MGFWYNFISRFYGFFSRRFIKRPFIREAIRRFGDKPVVGVEIGVADGFNARMFLKHLNIKKLYLVDPYVGVFSPLYQKMLRRLFFWIMSGRVVVIRKRGVDALSDIEGMVDFLYIDDSHVYSDVLRHIDLYVDKLRYGGLLGGHDFSIPDVARAVTEWSCRFDVPVVVNNPLVKVDWFYGD